MGARSSELCVCVVEVGPAKQSGAHHHTRRPRDWHGRVESRTDVPSQVQIVRVKDTSLKSW